MIPPESLLGPVAGFHPSDPGWVILLDHVLDQGLENLLQGEPWS